MVGRLSASWVQFCRVSDDAEGRLVYFDQNLINGSGQIGLVKQRRILGKHSDDSVDCGCRLVLVESKFEVHVHYNKI